MSISSIPVSSSILGSSGSFSTGTSTSSSSQSSGSFDNLPDLPFEFEISDDNEDIEEFRQKCEEFWRNEKVGGREKIKKSRMYLHLNGRIRPCFSFKYWLQKRQKRLQKNKTLTSTSDSEGESNSSSSLSTCSIFDADSSDEYILSDKFNVTRIHAPENGGRSEDSEQSFSKEKVKFDEEFEESNC